MTDTGLTAFLAARLDDDEHYARTMIDVGEHAADIATGNDLANAFGVAMMVMSDPRTRQAVEFWTENPVAPPNDLKRLLAEVEAKRALASLHAVNAEPERWGDSHTNPAMRGQPTGRTSYWCFECDHDRDYGHIGGPQEGCPTLRHLAAVYSDHPDYLPEWSEGQP
jgi:hypothetical protein